MTDRERIAELTKKNEALGLELHAAQEDLRKLDACEVCGWWDSAAFKCRCPQEIRRGAGCFRWRGRKRERLWENV